MTRLSEERLERALKELLREKALRVRLYPQWIKDGKLGEAEARERMEALDDAIQVLQDALKYKVMRSLLDG
jgi:hypothetical protein